MTDTDKLADDVLSRGDYIERLRHYRATHKCTLKVAMENVPRHVSEAAPDRYGNRTVKSMLRSWNKLREAVRMSGNPEVEAAFDACEEWIDYAFQHGKGKRG